MQKLYSNILETIGNTPIVKINSLEYDNIYAKLEYFNPAGSAKDRIAYNMLNEAIKRGDVDRETTVIEPTSGNTGVGLAFCCAVMGIKFVGIMPENMSLERIKLIKAYGAEVILTPKELGVKGSLDRADELKKEIEANHKKAYIPMQFENSDNPVAHEKTTAIEIYEQTEGKVDIVLSSIGTGGTISGVAKKLKELKPSVKIFGIEAFESPLLTKGVFGAHKIQGISANFIPKTLDLTLIDEILDIRGDDAYYMAREIAKNDGMLVGISSGAVLSGAKEIIKRYKNENPMIVAILTDNGERYLSGDLYE